MESFEEANGILGVISVIYGSSIFLWDCFFQKVRACITK